MIYFEVQLLFQKSSFSGLLLTHIQSGLSRAHYLGRRKMNWFHRTNDSISTYIFATSFHEQALVEKYIPPKHEKKKENKKKKKRKKEKKKKIFIYIQKDPRKIGIYEKCSLTRRSQSNNFRNFLFILAFFREINFVELRLY